MRYPLQKKEKLVIGLTYKNKDAGAPFTELLFFEAGPVTLLYSQDSPCRSVGFSGFFSEKPTLPAAVADADLHADVREQRFEVYATENLLIRMITR